MPSVVVVGASLAGVHAAATLRAGGFDGRLTVVDADPHPPYDRPPLSKQFLAGEWDAGRLALAPALDADVRWRLGTRASGVDLGGRRVRLVTPDGIDEEPYDGLVLAPGAAPRRLTAIPPAAGVHVLRPLDDALALRADLERMPSRVAVIGAGFLGSEVASTCRVRGLPVTVIEPLPTPLDRVLGSRVGAAVAVRQRDHGVDLRLGAGVTGLDAGGAPGTGVGRLHLSDGSTVDADVVVVAVGVAPATSWLEGSGLVLDDGVVVDGTLQAAPGVVAAGDVARYPSCRFGRSLRVEHWDHAVLSGQAAGRRLLADLGAGSDARAEVEAFDPVPWFWSDQFGLKLQVAGLTAGHDQVEVVHGDLAEGRAVALYGRAGRVVAVLGLNRPRHVAQLRSLVEAGAAWADAVSRARAA